MEDMKVSFKAANQKSQKRKKMKRKRSKKRPNETATNLEAPISNVTAKDDGDQSEKNNQKSPKNKLKRKQSHQRANETTTTSKAPISNVTAKDDGIQSETTSENPPKNKKMKRRRSSQRPNETATTSETPNSNVNARDDIKCTLFLRNVSFEVDDDALVKLFAPHGTVDFAKVVRNPLTGLSKGVAFVKFNSPDTQGSVLLKASKAENDPLFTLCGRRLIICPAVSREEAGRLHTVEEKQQQKQNAHLATVGLIREGSQKAEQLTEADRRRMNLLLQRKKAKLKDPNIFVSDRRLCVHNLPIHLEDQELRKIFMKHGGSGSKITECRIMRDLKNNRRSLGYGFVEFDSPQHAFQALQSINCNEEIFGPQRKPLVEFSLENRRALAVKEKRKLHQKKNGTNEAANSNVPISIKKIDLPVSKDAKLPKHLRLKKGGGVNKKKKSEKKKTHK